MSIELENTAADPNSDGKPTALAPGVQLGKYRLERVLGEGGMGVVWAARDPDLQRSVAIKVIKYAGASTQLRQRLLREAVAMAKLKHPNVLTVYEVGTVGDRDYIAMELVDGTSLADWLAMGHPFEPVWTALISAGRGLAAAHAGGVVHRDFKPHNVLRSRDGRVLVTDFGLARGVLDDPDAAGSATAPAPDSMLDTRLTQTGALVGTPAYMAPEQYQGAAPDPRTDQFAYCVTAWQALTGERPFKGDTLEELKKAVSSGVAHVSAKLPGPVRSALARGLHPDPARRWPSVEELIEELIEAERRPQRRRLVSAIAAAAVMATLTVLWIATRRPTPVTNLCENPAIAWGSPGPPFDAFKDDWIASYERACRARTSKVFAPRITCLASIRDQMAVMTEMRRTAPPDAYIDVLDLVPPIAQCEHSAPQAPPRLPRDEPALTPVFHVYSHLMQLRTAAPDQLAATSAALEQEAVAAGYRPATALVVLMTADAYAQNGDLANARATYRRALPLTQDCGDHRLEARVHIGLLELAMRELEHPGTPVPSHLSDPKVQPLLHPELASALIAARSAAGDDALLLGRVELIAADAYMQLAQWNRYRSAYDDALAHAAAARKQFDGLPDVRRAAQASALEAEILLARGDDRALDDALAAALRADDDLAAAHLSTTPELLSLRRRIAFARRSYSEVHRIADSQAERLVPGTTTITGHVTPPQRATVIAWRGHLVGDPRRAYIDADVPLDVVQTTSDGAFTLKAEPGWAIIAELGDMRSLPQVIGAGPVTLAIKPTQTLSGTVRGKNLLGVRAFAEYTVGESTWSLQVPVDRDGPFDLRGMPAGGTPVFGTAGEAGHATRTLHAAAATQLTWSSGQAVEVIVRGTADTVRVTSGKLDAATAAVRPVGASVTDAGREFYKPGDRHAVITGVTTGPVTACAGERCRSFTVEPSVSIEYPDGRFAAGVTPIILEP